jgi:ribosomal subunit interface protein
VDIVITARHAEITDRFRRQAEEKLSKVGQLAPRAQRIDVVVSHEANPRQSSRAERVELTIRDRGPVIRAEASADDLYGALDLAQEKLLERLRRARDRRKAHNGAAKTLPQPALAVPTPAEEIDDTGTEEANPFDGSPVSVREKIHPAVPMTLDDALYQMELVGHDFYLYVDSATSTPSVVYRRRGWSYGVLRLTAADAENSD